MSTFTSVIQMAVLVACIAMATLPHTQGRSADGFGRMGRLLASLKADSLGPVQDYGVEGAAHPLEKRQIFDSSCKGVYDRAIFSELEHVCNDCYNLYRTSRVASGCRSNCYSNVVIRQCMEDLLLMDNFEEIARKIQMVGKK
ncbi:crustacean hyperglycemic hormone-like isoform X1 [Scylla paramamosain]|uniref:CHH protein n=1 Tax=Scylla paramamosain TaxID=85552 RepID=H9CWU9_SCYPA|nr:CHH protein [Scylla paramamosain]